MHLGKGQRWLLSLEIWRASGGQPRLDEVFLWRVVMRRDSQADKAAQRTQQANFNYDRFRNNDKR